MNYMIKEEWTCPPSFIENVKPCAGSNTFSLKDDLESSTVASSLSSSCQDTHEPLTTKSSSGSINKNSNVQVTPKVSCHVENSEEFIRQKYEEDRECLKEAYNFLKQIAKHLMRGQAIVNTAMVYFLKYTRIHSVSQINKYYAPASFFIEFYLFSFVICNGEEGRVRCKLGR